MHRAIPPREPYRSYALATADSRRARFSASFRRAASLFAAARARCSGEIGEGAGRFFDGGVCVWDGGGVQAAGAGAVADRTGEQTTVVEPGEPGGDAGAGGTACPKVNAGGAGGEYPPNAGAAWTGAAATGGGAGRPAMAHASSASFGTISRSASMTWPAESAVTRRRRAEAMFATQRALRG